MHLLEERGHVVSVLADPRLEEVVLVDEAGKLALAVLGQALLLLEHVAELRVLSLQDPVLAVHLGHDNGIGGVRALYVARLGGGCSPAALRLGLLQDIEFSVGHCQFHGHATSSLLALDDGHVMLQLVVGRR